MRRRVFLASFPGLPHFSSSVCVQYNTRKRKILNANRRTKTGEAWERGYTFFTASNLCARTEPRPRVQMIARPAHLPLDFRCHAHFFLSRGAVLCSRRKLHPPAVCGVYPQQLTAWLLANVDCGWELYLCWGVFYLQC